MDTHTSGLVVVSVDDKDSVAEIEVLVGGHTLSYVHHTIERRFEMGGGGGGGGGGGMIKHGKIEALDGDVHHTIHKRGGDLEERVIKIEYSKIRGR